ncbi:hypothetical protein ACN47E_008234 [Coniothyrium glycines]
MQLQDLLTSLTTTGQRGIVWLCSFNSTGLTEHIGPENDPLNLIGTTASFKNDVLFCGLLFMAVALAVFCSVLLATFPGLQEEHDERTGCDVNVKPFPSRSVLQVAMSNTFVATMLLLTDNLWQHVGAVGTATVAVTTDYGNVKAVIGVGAMA